jgi:hypothetical protein
VNAAAVPPEIVELAQSGRTYVELALGVEIDFQPETLAMLDHYAASVRPEIEKNPALAALIAPALGAYFGEVLRVRLRGFWRVPSANQQDWSVCSRVVFLAINPIGVGYDAIYGGNEHAGPRSTLRVAPEDTRTLDERLSAMPEVPEDEYFSFTTRYEVLEVALEALGNKMQDEGYGGTEFTEEDYGLDYG